MTKEFGFALVVLLAIVVGLMWLLTWLTNSPVNEIERGIHRPARVPDSGQNQRRSMSGGVSYSGVKPKTA